MSRPKLGRSSVFGLEKRLQFFGLRTGSSEIDLVEVRDSLGWCGAVSYPSFFSQFLMALLLATCLLPLLLSRRSAVRIGGAAEAQAGQFL